MTAFPSGKTSSGVWRKQTSPYPWSSRVVSRPETQTDVNRFAREIVRTNLISFGGLHPDCPHVLEEIEKLKDLHMAGVKFHPPFQKVHLEDRENTGKYGRGSIIWAFRC